MPKGQDRGRKGGRYRPKKGPRRYHRRDDAPSTEAKLEIIATGHAGDVGLDGKLRVELAPLKLSTAEELSRRKGAAVMNPKGDTVGRVDTVVGTLEHPVAVVRVHPDMRKEASQMRGGEVFLG